MVKIDNGMFLLAMILSSIYIIYNMSSTYNNPEFWGFTSLYTTALGSKTVNLWRMKKCRLN